MSLRFRYKCDEGTGNTLNDDAGSYDLSAVSGHNIKWAYGNVLGTNRYFVTMPRRRSGVYDGVIENATGIGTGISVGSMGFVCRWIGISNSGALIRIGGNNVRSWSERIDQDSTSRILAQTADIPFDQWFIMVFDWNGSTTLYLDDMTTALTTLGSGWGTGTSVIRLLANEQTNYASSFEVADVSIWDHQLSSAERTAYKNSFSPTYPDNYSFYKDHNDDFGGLYRWDEESGGTYSELTIASLSGSKVIKHTFPGDICQGAVAHTVKRNLTKFYMESNIYVPTGFDVNHDLGIPMFLIMATFDALPPAVAGETFAVRLRSSAAGVNPTLTLEEVTYKNTSGQTDIALDNTVMTYNTWHHFKAEVDRTGGTIKLWVDGVLKCDSSGLTLDLPPLHAYYGMGFGIHPQNTGNFYYSKGQYFGEVERAVGRMKSSKQFKSNALQIIFDEERS